MARRMPISRVRSVTDTSMMFMMPMPPTSRLTAATAPSRPVSIAVVPAVACTICFMSRTEKSSSLPGAMLRRSRSSRSMSACTLRGLDAVLGRDHDAADVGVAGDAPLEGAQRHDDDVVLVACRSSTGPSTPAGRSPRRRPCRRGCCARADRRGRTACRAPSSPMMQAARPPRSSPSRNCRPACSAQSCVMK